MKNNLRPFWFMADPVIEPAAGSTPPATPPAATPPATPTTAPATTTAPANTPVEDFFSKAPENWRDSLLQRIPEAEREKAKPFFDRVSSIDGLANNYYESQKKIRSGLPPEDALYLPKNATPEQITEYRKKADVPESPEKYELALDDGLVLSKEDKAFFGPVFAVMHAAHIPNAVAGTLVNEYLKLEQKNLADTKLRDDHQTQETRLALKKVWGVDTQRNFGLIEMFMQDLPKEVRDDVLGSRMPDGSAVFNNPAFLQFLLAKQKEINPMATVVPQGGSEGLKSMEDELADLKKLMKNDRQAWFKDDKKQARYRELTEAIARVNKK